MMNVEDIKDPKYLLRIIEQINDRLSELERTPIVQQSLSGSAETASPKSCPRCGSLKIYRNENQVLKCRDCDCTGHDF